LYLSLDAGIRQPDSYRNLSAIPRLLVHDSWGMVIKGPLGSARNRFGKVSYHPDCSCLVLLPSPDITAILNANCCFHVPDYRRMSAGGEGGGGGGGTKMSCMISGGLDRGSDLCTM